MKQVQRPINNREPTLRFEISRAAVPTGGSRAHAGRRTVRTRTQLHICLILPRAHLEHVIGVELSRRRKRFRDSLSRYLTLKTTGSVTPDQNNRHSEFNLLFQKELL